MIGSGELHDRLGRARRPAAAPRRRAHARSARFPAVPATAKTRILGNARCAAEALGHRAVPARAQPPGQLQRRGRLSRDHRPERLRAVHTTPPPPATAPRRTASGPRSACPPAPRAMSGCTTSTSTAWPMQRHQRRRPDQLDRRARQDQRQRLGRLGRQRRHGSSNSGADRSCATSRSPGTAAASAGRPARPCCWAQQTGGYGDGLGTTSTGGQWLIEDSFFHHNTSDGLDLLLHGRRRRHLR